MSDEAGKGSEEAIDTFDDAFLKKIEMGMLSQIALQAGCHAQSLCKSAAAQ